MSTLPEIVAAIAREHGAGSRDGVRRYLLQAAAKLHDKNPQRSEAIKRHCQQLEALPLADSLSGKWFLLKDQNRVPAIPAAVRERIGEWMNEAEYAESLALAGERVRPLLLDGETRCGKTSLARDIADRFQRPAYRLDLSSVIGSYLGESAKEIRKALEVARGFPNALLIIDEIDAITSHRGSKDAADKERSHALACLLAWLEELPATTLIVCTTNRIDEMDYAVVSRMSPVKWMSWLGLSDAEKRAFERSHGVPEDDQTERSSYSQAVEDGRRYRVARIIASARAEAAE